MHLLDLTSEDVMLWISDRSIYSPIKLSGDISSWESEREKDESS
jgi:hypothetical protein